MSCRLGSDGATCRTLHRPASGALVIFHSMSAQSVSTLGGFLAGGVAACGAVTFTNPIELVKTRMQLQGELSANSSKMYRNPIQAFAVIFRNEGIRGLQQGLVCGYLNQLCLNGCRIGLYEPCRYQLTKLLYPDTIVEGKAVPQTVPVNIVSGFLAGSAGAVMASPFFLIKTRMQSYSAAAASGKVHSSTGQQTYYRNTADGLRKIYTSEGVKGLFRGVDAAIFRTGAGSAAQLPLYYFTKHLLEKYTSLDPTSLAMHFLLSLVAGVGVAIVMNPGDVILTRVYNQKGNLYKGPIDCLVKTVSTEGVGALYKGFWAQLLRIGPHSILTLMFMEQCMRAMVYLENDGFQRARIYWNRELE